MIAGDESLRQGQHFILLSASLTRGQRASYYGVCTQWVLLYTRQITASFQKHLFPDRHSQCLSTLAMCRQFSFLILATVLWSVIIPILQTRRVSSPVTCQSLKPKLWDYRTHSFPLVNGFKGTSLWKSAGGWGHENIRKEAEIDCSVP